MKTSRYVDVIYTHTHGEPTCIVLGRIPYPPDSNIWQKRRFLESEYDWLRRALMREPRGHHHMFGVFVTPPSTSDNHAGLIWMDGDRFHDMCGHGTIGASMALVATGHVPATPPVTTIRFETTAGSVTTEVASDGQSVEWARFENVPSFLAERDIQVTLPEVGQVVMDVAFGGNYFGIVHWQSTNLTIRPQNGRRFAELGAIAKAGLRKKVSVRHPVHSHIDQINFVTFFHESSSPGVAYRNVHVFSDGKLDRSPGGTGTSAVMAMLEARDRLALGEPICIEGLLGSGAFEGHLIEETRVGNHRAVVPRIKGTANITGYARWILDPDDPLNEGFVVS